MPTNNTFDTGKSLANVFAAEIDKPQTEQYSNPSYANDPGFPQFSKQLSDLLQGLKFSPSGYNPQQFGETQNPPQYRGIRFLLPQSGGEYEEAFNQGKVPQYQALQQAVLGWLIQMGYPVLGGTGQIPGFEEGFNPVGFGQK